MPGLSALLYKDGIDLCSHIPGWCRATEPRSSGRAGPRPWGGAGLSSQVCVSVCPQHEVPTTLA